MASNKNQNDQSAIIPLKINCTLKLTKKVKKEDRDYATLTDENADRDLILLKTNTLFPSGFD